MEKEFNVEGACRPEVHYMVNIKRVLNEINGLVDRGKYFVMNRARQYGKTTTLRELKSYLEDKYFIINLDFQIQMSTKLYSGEVEFSIGFARAKHLV